MHPDSIAKAPRLIDLVLAMGEAPERTIRGLCETLLKPPRSRRRTSNPVRVPPWGGERKTVRSGSDASVSIAAASTFPEVRRG